MRIIIPLLFLLFLTQLSIAQVKVQNLTTDHQTNPLAIESHTPLLSWQLLSDERGQKQTAYQILVASSKEKLMESADIWNSGKVQSDQSLYVPYKEKTLVSKQQFYWKVRVWDVNDKPSEYSTVNTWETGLLNDSDWGAYWISAPVIFDFEKLNQHRYKMVSGQIKEDYSEPLPLLRKEFSASPNILKARAYIAAPGLYEMYLNGQKVGNYVLDPAYTNYDKTVLYTVYDVTALIRNGDNAIGVMLGNGWYNSPSKEVWGLDKAPWKSLPCLKFLMEITYSDGSVQTITSDTSWQAAPGPIVFSSLYQGEYYDARLENDKWSSPGLLKKDWQRVRKVAGPIGQLQAQEMPHVKVIQTFEPINQKTLLNGNVVYDFGQNAAGFVKINVSGDAGTRLQFKYAEKVDSTGAADLSGVNNLLAEPFMQTDHYTLKGTAKEEWSPRFNYHGFRYVEVSVEGKKPQINWIRSCAISSVSEDKGSFKCSNELVNKIQENTRWSFRSNFVGIPTDCPQREKNGWTGDPQLACEAGLSNFLPVNSYQKWLNDIRNEQMPDGSLPAIIPTAGWGFYWGNGPSWDIVCIIIPYSLYEYTGDLQVLANNYGMMKKYVDYMQWRSPGYITDFGLGDWVPYKTETPVAVTSTGYYYYATSTLSKIAELLGKKTDAETYKNLSVNIKVAFNQKFFNTKEMTYANGSQTALSCALFQGLVEDKWKENIVTSLRTAVERNNGHLDCGILGARYILHALTDNGQAQMAFDMVTKTDLPGWGYWISQGATTLWEDWKGTASLNHIMFGDVSSWFYKTLGGINPDETEPGFRHFILRPTLLNGISWVNSSFDCLYGKIVSNWKIEGAKLFYDIIVPPNTTTTLYIPAKGIPSVWEGDKPLTEVIDIKIVRTMKGIIVLELPSGKYSFRSAI